MVGSSIFLVKLVYAFCYGRGVSAKYEQLDCMEDRQTYNVKCVRGFDCVK